VRIAGRNNQLDFRSGSAFAPNFQLPAKALGTLSHPQEPPVSRTRALIGNFRMNPTPIVSHVGNPRFGNDSQAVAETEAGSERAPKHAVSSAQRVTGDGPLTKSFRICQSFLEHRC